MKVKKGDFIEINYLGKIKSTGKVFDLTKEEDAKKYDLYSPNVKHSPKIICVGENEVIKGLDEALIDKEEKKAYTIELSSEKAFGKRNANLKKVFLTSNLKKEKIHPFPGLQLNFNGILGTVVSVGGGRTTVDFNHPLAGKELIYEIEIVKIVKDDKEKLKSIMLNGLGLTEDNYELKGENGSFGIKLKAKIPSDIKQKFLEKVKELIPHLKVFFEE